MPHLLVLSYSGKFSGVCITRQFAALSIITEKTAFDKTVFVKFETTETTPNEIRRTLFVRYYLKYNNHLRSPVRCSKCPVV